MRLQESRIEQHRRFIVGQAVELDVAKAEQWRSRESRDWRERNVWDGRRVKLSFELEVCDAEPLLVEREIAIVGHINSQTVKHPFLLELRRTHGCAYQLTELWPDNGVCL